MTRLHAQGLNVSRAGKPILQDAGLTAASGDFVAVIGPNGAGKSTLLSLIAGLTQSDTGEVRLDDRFLGAIPRRELAQRRAYLPQNPRCEWPLPVERLVALGLTPNLPPFGDLPPRMKADVAKALAACDLTDRADQPATTLSGGELARAMLARALVADPEVLIFDEPLAGLDPRHAYDVAARLRRLADEGKLVIAAMHDLTITARYATRVLVLSHGQVLADGRTETTLTSDLLRRAFEIEANVVGRGPGAFVDIASPAAARA